MIDHEKFESATMALLATREFLEQCDEATALYLEGLDLIESSAMCRVVQRRLIQAQSHTKDTSAKHYLAMALNAVDRAIGEPVLLATG